MIWAKKRFKVLERDNFRCQYCWKNGKDVSLEIDHIIPKAKWWTDDFNNLITCCRECNIWKWKDIIWVSNWNAKIKIADHENAMIKKFFSVRNDNSYGTIDKNNLTFFSWFIKLFYWKPLTKFIEDDFVIVEFNEGWKICDEALDKFDKMVWDYTLSRFIQQIWDIEMWNTDDNNLKLNYLITSRMFDIWLPVSFNFKYSLFPKMIEQWQTRQTNE
jgi:hypothetical protein